MSEAAFVQGFMDKCAEAGVDPDALLKAAQYVPPYNVPGVPGAQRGVSATGVPYTRRAGHYLSPVGGSMLPDNPALATSTFTPWWKRLQQQQQRRDPAVVAAK